MSSPAIFLWIQLETLLKAPLRIHQAIPLKIRPEILAKIPPGIIVEVSHAVFAVIFSRISPSDSCRNIYWGCFMNPAEIPRKKTGRNSSNIQTF